MRPVERMPTLRGHLRMDSGPMLGYWIWFSSTQLLPSQTAEGLW